MKSDVIFYLVASLTVVFTFGATLILPIPDSYRGLITFPGLMALIGIVVEAWRDKRGHEKALELLIRQQNNSLAIASHMAAVVFDRQVEFCEAYFEKVHTTLLELFTSGPAPTALMKAKELAHIRIKYSPWLSPQIESGLLPFEKALREVGVDAQLIATRLPQPDHEMFVQKMYDAFVKVSHITEPLGGDSPEEAISSIINHLRMVLGVSKLTKLRDQALNTATIRADALPK
ncbi:MAG: hypothetical protein ROW52_13080 [Anaerolineaceae bacterium]|jgi:hypothetical protein